MTPPSATALDIPPSALGTSSIIQPYTLANSTVLDVAESGDDEKDDDDDDDDDE